MENPNELLLSAAKTGDVAALARALKAGADRETKGSNDWTALILSAFHNRAGFSAQSRRPRAPEPQAFDVRLIRPKVWTSPSPMRVCER